MTIVCTVKNYSSINMCEVNTNWTGGSPAAVTDFFKEGSNCLGFTLRGTASTYVETYYAWSGSLSAKHLHAWFMTSSIKEMTYVYVGLYDGTNYGWYRVLSNTEYAGGWFNISLDCARTPDFYGATKTASGTPPTLGSITRIYFSMYVSAQAKNAQNTWIDSIYTGDGIIATGTSGSDTTVYTLADILAIDQSVTTNYGWGMIRKIGGIYYLVGSLEIGSASGTTNTYFNDTSQVIVFENRPVSTSFYYIAVYDNGTGATRFSLGAKSGTSGISGCVVRVESTSQTPKFYIFGNNTNVDYFQLYGTTFLDADSITFPADATNVEVLNCNFESCGTVEPSTAKTEYCNFISANSIGAKLTTASHKLKNSNFVSCAYGIEITISSASFPLDNVKFSGNTKDIYYTAASGNLTIGLTNGANASTFTATGTGTVYFSNDISVKVYVYNDAGAVIVGAVVAVYKTSGMTEIMNEATDSGGLAETTYNLSGDTPVTIRIRKSSTGGTRYFPAETGQTLTGNFRLDWTLQSDQIASA